MAKTNNKGHTEETKQKISKALMNNNNAEKYTYKQAEELLSQAVELSYDLEFDFIGEIAKVQKVTRRLYDHLITRFPELRELFEMMKSNLEANCYENTKKNKINTAAGVINLKSNHKWTDRNDVTTQDKELKPTTTIINLGQGIKPQE